MKRLFAIALVLLAGVARAEGPPKATDLIDYDKGKDVVVAPGGTARAVLTFKVKDGWHVNAHVPHEDYLVPTVVTLSSTIDSLSTAMSAMPRPGG